MQATTIARPLLVAAAGLSIAAGARAADLPVKAKPAEYVKICSLYGAGFYYIPGTDTCIRVFGHIREDLGFLGRGVALQGWVANADGNSTLTRNRDIFTARTRVYTQVDTRTQTAFGTLRTYSVSRFETSTGVGLAEAGSGVTAISTGIIQWGGFSIGRATTSYFENPWQYAAKWGVNSFYGNPDTTAGQFVAAYTHDFGNGISASVSMEANKERRRGQYNGNNALSLLGVVPTLDTRGGETWPEIVGQFRINQSWGGFHLSGHLFNTHTAYNCGAASGTTTVAAGGCSELAGAPADKVAGGVNVAARFNVPTGVNDAVYIGGSWGRGATPDVFGNNGQGAAFGIYRGTSLPGAYGSVTGSYVWDSVYTSTTRTGAGITVGPVGHQLTTAYGAAIAFEHGWNAQWRTSLIGGVEFLDYNTEANAILCSRFGFGSASGTLTAGVGGANISNTGACNWDYRVAGIGSRTYWSPVRDFTLGVEVHWSNHHVGHADGTVYNQPVISFFKPNAAYEIRDQNVFTVGASVRRFF